MKIKRFIDCYVPVTTCTLRCHYCYVTVHRKFEGPLPTFKYTPEQVGKALSAERMGGVCLINLCAGGETLLTPAIVDYIRVFLEEGHYVMVVTNATVTKRLQEIATFPSHLLSHLFFKFSYHYLELKQRGLLESFFSNVRMMRDAGCSFTLEVTPSDELIPYIDDVKSQAIEHVGAVPHVTVARDEKNPEVLPILTSLPLDEYKKVWGTFDSALFAYKASIFGVKRHEFCYAGDWSVYLNLATGEMSQCYTSAFHQNIFEHPEKPIRFLPVGKHCREHHCYNGHAFLTFGDIPELNAPNYLAMRDRTCQDGSHWVKPEVAALFSSKLNESNQEYSRMHKEWFELRHIGHRIVSRLKSRIKRIICK